MPAPSLGQGRGRGHGRGRGTHKSPAPFSGSHLSATSPSDGQLPCCSALCIPTVGYFYLWPPPHPAPTVPARAPRPRPQTSGDAGARRGPRGWPGLTCAPGLCAAGDPPAGVRESSSSGPAALTALILSPGPAPPADGGARPPWLRLRAAPGGRRVSVAAPRAPAPRPGSPPPCRDGGAGAPPAARCARGLARPGAWGAWDPGRLWSQASQDQV